MVSFLAQKKHLVRIPAFAELKYVFGIIIRPRGRHLIEI